MRILPRPSLLDFLEDVTIFHGRIVAQSRPGELEAPRIEVPDRFSLVHARDVYSAYSRVVVLRSAITSMI